MLFWQWQAGKFAACDSIPLADRGFRYGMSVFESFRVMAGKPVFLDEHLERLRQACEQVHFKHENIAPEAVRRTLAGLDGLARLYVTAGEADAAASRVILFIEERAPLSPEKRVTGYHLALDSERRRPLFGGLKTANYWANLWAFSRARQRGKDETLLRDEAGSVLSASLANLFVVRSGRIETPPAGAGARAGVVRAWVMCRRPVREGALTVEDLTGADEMFLTSSWLGVMPAASLEDQPLPHRSIALQLHSEYEAELAGGKLFSRAQD